MVKITKGGGTEKLVTAGAFNSIFKKQGWEIVDEIEEVEVEEIEEEEIEEVEEFVEEEELEDEDEEFEDEEVVEEDDLEFEIDNIFEKPISEMSFKELVKYAKVNGIETKGLKSKKEIIEVIKEEILQQ